MWNRGERRGVSRCLPRRRAVRGCGAWTRRAPRTALRSRTGRVPPRMRRRPRRPPDRRAHRSSRAHGSRRATSDSGRGRRRTPRARCTWSGRGGARAELLVELPRALDHLAVLVGPLALDRVDDRGLLLGVGQPDTKHLTVPTLSAKSGHEPCRGAGGLRGRREQAHGLLQVVTPRPRRLRHA